MTSPRVRIVDGPIPSDAGPEPRYEPRYEPRHEPTVGAEIVFFGRVRDREDGNPIRALYYEQYPGMAEREIGRLIDETERSHPSVTVFCEHSVGEVPVGDASLRVVVRSPHRAEGLTALAAFIDGLKARVPIWKWAVSPDGERTPTKG